MSDIDQLVGKRVRRRRIELGYASTKLAHAVGITVQELAAYEAGAARPAPALLVQITKKLNISVASLFAEPETRATEMFTEHVKQSPELHKADNNNTPLAAENNVPAAEHDQSESAN